MASIARSLLATEENDATRLLARMLVAASQRLALAKLLHSRLSIGCSTGCPGAPCHGCSTLGCLTSDTDVIAHLGGKIVRCAGEVAYEVARDDPEVDVALLKGLEEATVEKQSWALGMLERDAAEAAALDRAVRFSTHFKLIVVCFPANSGLFWTQLRASAAVRQRDGEPHSPPAAHCRLWADGENAAAGQLLTLIREALAQGPLDGRPGAAPYNLLPFASLPTGSADPSTLLWDCPADGVHGVIESKHDVELFAREVFYRSGLKRRYGPGTSGSYHYCPGNRHPTPTSGAVPRCSHPRGWPGAGVPDDVNMAVWSQDFAEELTTHGVAVCPDFLGADAAQALCDADLGGADDAMSYGEGRAGAGRGDNTCLPDTLPETLLTSAHKRARTTRSASDRLLVLSGASTQWSADSAWS